MEIIERYAARWSIEVAFHDAKHITGAGEARNRTKLAVERTAPFGMPHPSYQDMLTKLRRVLIAAQFRADSLVEPILEQIQAIRLAWADAAA